MQRDVSRRRAVSLKPSDPRGRIVSRRRGRGGETNPRGLQEAPS